MKLIQQIKINPNTPQSLQTLFNLINRRFRIVKASLKAVLINLIK